MSPAVTMVTSAPAGTGLPAADGTGVAEAADPPDGAPAVVGVDSEGADAAVEPGAEPAGLELDGDEVGAFGVSGAPF